MRKMPRPSLTNLSVGSLIFEIRHSTPQAPSDLITNVSRMRRAESMLILIQGLLGLVLIGELVCYILVLIKMFQAGEQTMGIICIVLTLCCGIGGLVAF